MKSLATPAAFALALSIPAAAAAAPVYFHKPNVDRETFVAEFTECDELASGVRAPRYNVYSPNIYAMAANSFFAGFFGSREKRHMTDNVLRTCMTDKGYRRVEASGEVRKELNKLSEQDRVDRLFGLAAAPDPAGKVLPR